MKLVKLILTFVVCTSVWGCAVVAQKENMIARSNEKSYSEEIQNNITLGEVFVAKYSKMTLVPMISTESFAVAVEESLKAQGLYSDDGKYRLKVNMFEVDWPLIGINHEVTTQTQYTLTSTEDETVIFDETITAIHTANFLTSTLSHLKALILFAINLKLHTTAFAFLKALLLFLLGFYHSSGFIRFCLNSAQLQLFYAALSCAPAWRQQRYKSLVARA